MLAEALKGRPGRSYDLVHEHPRRAAREQPVKPSRLHGNGRQLHLATSWSRTGSVWANSILATTCVSISGFSAWIAISLRGLYAAWRLRA